MKNIAIIGAGIAGINSAILLKKSGYSVSLFEASNSIGGRSRSFFDKNLGYEIDNGTHLMVGAYRNFFEILKKLDTFKLLKHQKSLMVKYIDNKQKHNLLDTSHLPGDFGILFGLLKMKNLSRKEKFNIIRFTMDLRKGRFDKLIDTSCYTFLISENQTENSIRLLWEPIILATINSPIEEASAKLLVNVLKDSFFGDKNSGNLYFPTVPLSKLLVGFEEFFIDEYCTLHLNKKIESIEKVEGKYSLIGKSEKFEGFDKVIIANNYNELRKLRDNSNSFDIELYNFKSSGILTVYLKYDKEFTNEPFLAMMKTKSQWLFNKNKLFEIDSEEQLYSVVISAANNLMNLSDGEIIEIVKGEILECLPEAIDAKLIVARVIREKSATLVFDAYSNSERPSNQTSNPDILIAGDWTNTGYPCTLESAAISGATAVEIINNNQN